MKIQIDASELDAMMWTDGTQGACLACGSWTDGVEPDARGYECPACGERKVYGAQELLMMDAFEVRGEEEHDQAVTMESIIDGNIADYEAGQKALRRMS